jgi:eukaryotic-like serine/threonine-protein kinase
MLDEIRIREILDGLDANCHPEDACGDDAELLREVRLRWEKMQRVQRHLDDLLPENVLTRRDNGVPANREPDLPQIDGYDVQSVLGRGGMGVVFKARQRKLNRFVAVKMMLTGQYAGPLEVARFRREVEAVAALRHHNIVQIYDVGDQSGRHFFTMELVEAGSLAQQLAGKPRRAAKAAETVATLASAVQFAHKSGFMHRDLKPANILLTADGTPKITDFGLVRSIDGGPEFTLSGTRVGTPCYMAPEQALGKVHEIGPAVDVYALGAILYEMLTGRPPFEAESVAATEQQVIAAEPVPPSRLNSKVPRDLETICLKCLQKNPSRRYASAQDLADDLYRFLDGKPVLARPIGIVSRTVKWARRRPIPTLLIVSAMAAIGAGIWFYQRESLHGAERATRQTNARQAIDTDIVQAYQLANAERFPEARLLLAEATNHLANAESDDLRQRLAGVETEIQFAEELADGRQAAAGARSEQLGVPEREILELLTATYRDSFARAGIDIADAPALTAERVRASPLRGMIVAALDNWAFAAMGLGPELEEYARLLAIARQADPNAAWSDRFRDPAAWRDLKRLRQLAKDAMAATEAPPAHQVVITALLLRRRDAKSEGMALLRDAVHRYPTDFWLNWEIAAAYVDDRNFKESAPYFRVLVALRPHQKWTVNRLGCALAKAGEFEEAIAYFRDALRLGPEDLKVRHNLVLALIKAGRMPEALAEAERAVQAEPASAQAAYTFGMALTIAERHEESIAMYRKAAELDPKWTECQFNVGNLLRAAKRPEQAVAVLRKALELDGGSDYGHATLCQSLYDLERYEEAIVECEWVIRRVEATKSPELANSANHFCARHVYAESLFCLGRFAEARSAAQSFLNLGTNIKGREAIRHQLKLCERLVPAETHLSKILGGAGISADAGMVWALAEWCGQFKHASVTSVRFFEQAFKQQPALAADLDAKHRFHAACAAVQVGWGLDAEAAKLDDNSRAAFRKKAYDWLRADCDAWIERHQNGKSGELPARTMEIWQKSKELAAIREEAALAKAPERERKDWQKLWADVNALALRSSGPLAAQARLHAARQEWAKAAECYAQLKFAVPADGMLCFEAAAAQLLAGDRDGYEQTCKFMSGDKRMRGYLVARARTLAPASVADIMHASELADNEFNKNEKAFWSLTERGALLYRTNRLKDAIELFEKSLAAESKPGAAVVNRLWLAMAHQKLGNTDEARSLLHKARTFLDGVGRELPANSESFGLHRHNWLEAHVLLREAEALIGPMAQK